jgi:UDP-glucose 6-dehydrogenase
MSAWWRRLPGETGNDVVCVDKDADKIARLRKNDPDLRARPRAMVRRNQARAA